MRTNRNPRDIQLDSQNRHRHTHIFENLLRDNPSVLELCATLFPDHSRSVWTGSHSLVCQRKSIHGSSIHERDVCVMDELVGPENSGGWMVCENSHIQLNNDEDHSLSRIWPIYIATFAIRLKNDFLFLLFSHNIDLGGNVLSYWGNLSLSIPGLSFSLLRPSAGPGPPYTSLHKVQPPEEHTLLDSFLNLTH
ncbi:hypothetical protein NE237_014236 [Protea cynaroides]|uniref:Uncharacterized protein n=1 Tax=Protea cynaroides TaxID=273540 RepID=A0A9Q0GMD7_9MAGN|nr:hypothetical protein NE237_014236 [Protea cynaroides]